MRFHATLELAGKTATGIVVPPEIIDALGQGKKPAIMVTINGASYRTTIGVMGGRFLIPVSAENRAKTGLTAGDKFDVDVELDTEPRVVTVPPELATALAADPIAKQRFDALSYSKQQQHTLAVSGAKTAETRQRRIDSTIAALRAGG